MGPGIPARPAPLRPAGGPEGPRFRALQLGAKALQSAPPLRGFDAYLVGFHPAKDEPSMQMEAHHYCKVVGELMNSYGKTWHTWHTGRHDSGGGHDLPLGDPMLMWSFNRDGESDPALAADRAEAMGIDTAEVRRRRQELLERAAPQRGVDALRDRFTGTTPIPGVEELGATPNPIGGRPDMPDQPLTDPEENA